MGVDLAVGRGERFTFNDSDSCHKLEPTQC